MGIGPSRKVAITYNNNNNNNRQCLITSDVFRYPKFFLDDKNNKFFNDL